MQTMAPLLAINSMREFYGGSLIAVNDNYTGKDFDPRYATLGPNLEVIELAGCCMTPRECAKFTKGMRRLKSFKLAYEVKWHGCGYEWSAGQFVAALMASVGGTLERLSLSIYTWVDDLITAVTDLRGFKKLKELELDTQVLVGPPYTSDVGFDEDLREVTGVPPKVPRLLDLLPPSLEKLDLLTDTSESSTQCLQALFTDFVAEKDTILPHLKHVTIRRGTEGSYTAQTIVPKHPLFLDAVLAACESAGVKIVDKDKPAHASFMLDFEDRFGVLAD